MSSWRTLLGCGGWTTVLLVALTYTSPAAAAKIACVGDSITYGYGLSNPSAQSYPAVLQTLVGSTHTVQNFGVSSCTLLKSGDRPYWKESAFTSSDTFDPDVVIVMLGTNDAKPQNWSHKADFTTDYRALVEHYRGLGALVYVAAPPPVFQAGAFTISPDVLNKEIVPLVRQIAADLDAPLIDVFQALTGKDSYFPDTIHPDAQGARLLAETVAAALREGGFGGATASTDAGAGGRASGGAAGNGAGGRASGGAAGNGTAGNGTAGNQGGRLGAGGATEAGSGGAAAAGTGGRASGGALATDAGTAGTGRNGGAGGGPAAGASGGELGSGGRTQGTAGSAGSKGGAGGTTRAGGGAGGDLGGNGGNANAPSGVAHAAAGRTAGSSSSSAGHIDGAGSGCRVAASERRPWHVHTGSELLGLLSCALLGVWRRRSRAAASLQDEAHDRDSSGPAIDGR